MRIALLQAPARINDVRANLHTIVAAAAEAREGSADVLITPELFVTGYAPARVHDCDREAIEQAWGQLSDIAKECGVALITSLPDITPDGEWYIAAVLFDSTGKELARYRKVHLFGPEEKAAFAAGNALPPVVELAQSPVALAVCYDIEFPETARAAALAGADILFVPTALAGPYDEVPDILIRARAIENGLSVVYANHSGQEGDLQFLGRSIAVLPNGAIAAQAGSERVLIFADIPQEAVHEARSDVDRLADRRTDLYAGWGSA